LRDLAENRQPEEGIGARAGADGLEPVTGSDVDLVDLSSSVVASPKGRAIGIQIEREELGYCVSMEVAIGLYEGSSGG
jgi:hypothetical protein